MNSIGLDELQQRVGKANGSAEAQIAFALRQAESGTPVVEITRKIGV